MKSVQRNPILCSLLSIGVSSAVIYSSGALAVEPNPIELGNLQIIPTIGISTMDDDNIFRAPANEIDSLITTTTPRIQAILNSGPNEFVLDLDARNGEFEETNEDDYFDWTIQGSAHIELNANNALDFTAFRDDAHEFRGTGFSQGVNIPTDPDEFVATRFEATYTLGNADSLGRIELNLGTYEKEYNNNLRLTEFREREDDYWSATFFYNLSPRTSILAEYREREIEYPNSLPGVSSLNSEEQYVFVGIEWEATAATTGSIRVGNGDKDFGAADRNLIDLPSVEADLTWSPVDYSIVTLFASQLFDETNGFGNAIERRTFGVNWQHEWTPNLSTNITLSNMDEEYSEFARDDEFNVFSAGLTYSVARWLDVGVDIGRDDRDSTAAVFANERNFVAIRLEAGL